MAKKSDTDSEQLDLFPIDPEIRNLGVTEFKLSGSALTGKLLAVTDTSDIALLTPERWGEAAAVWLVKLFGGDWFKIHAAVNRAHSEYCDELAARRKDEEIGFSRISTTAPSRAAAPDGRDEAFEPETDAPPASAKMEAHDAIPAL
jgi:hypothetical protein